MKYSTLTYPHICLTGITYGADAFLVFDHYVTKGEALDRVSTKMKIEVQKIHWRSSLLNFNKIDRTETSKKNQPNNIRMMKHLSFVRCYREEFKPKIVIANYQHSPLDITSRVEEIAFIPYYK